MTSRTILLLSLILAAAPAAADSPAAQRLGAVGFEPCTLRAAGSPATVSAYCGSFAVPEDRNSAGSRRIELALALVPARARRPEPDPVFLLAGGPGQSAREAYPGVAGAFAEILRHRHVVLVDQRGTGGSNALHCRWTEEEGRAIGEDPAAARRLAAACAESLEADLRHYTTSDAVADLEAVREAIGAERINLVGGSYGTRVGLEYLRRHPGRVRTLVLDGVVPPGLALGAEHARNLEAALDAHFALCEADATCAASFGASRARLAELLEELRAEPRRVSYRDPLSHEPREEVLTPATVTGVVRLFSYAPQLAAMLPYLLAEATAGRPEVLMAQSRMIDNLVGEQFAVGMQLSVICAEDADRLRVDPADERTLLGTSFVATLLAQCETWPRGRRPPDFAEPVRSDAAVLLLSGGLDPVTPPRYGAEVLRDLSRGRHLVVRGQGHGVMGVGCMPRLVANFVRSGDVTGLDAGCLDRLAPPPPFAGAWGWEP